MERLAALPPDILGRCLSYATRWSAVSCSQLVCKSWRALCRSRRVELAPLALATVSGKARRGAWRGFLDARRGGTSSSSARVEVGACRGRSDARLPRRAVLDARRGVSP